MCTICEACKGYGAWVIESRPLTVAQFNYLLPVLCRGRLCRGATRYGQVVYSVLTTSKDWLDIQARLKFLD